MSTGAGVEPQPILQRPSTFEKENPWPLYQKVGFRFLFSYFVLYLFPYPVGSLGNLKTEIQAYRNFCIPIVSWVGAHVFGIREPIKQIANGSGDQVFDYVLLFCILVVSVVATVIWSWLDRKRADYEWLNQWLRLMLRFSLGAAMMLYGADKIFRMQFPEPALARFVDTYGRTSPMGLLWAFMGMSRAYSFFGGLGETVGGVLLFIPQFTLLGALVSLAVLANVLMLNFCYDVPRKIYTTHLILMGLVLIWPDMKRLLNILVFNRATEPRRQVPLFNDKFLNRAVLVGQILVGLGCFYFYMQAGYVDQENIASVRLTDSIRGIWSVQDISIDGVPHPPLLTDTERWQRVIFDDSKILLIQDMDGAFNSYLLDLNLPGKSFTLSKRKDAYYHASFTFERPDPNVINIDGQAGGQRIQATLRRVDLSDPERFLLLNRGFHWVDPTLLNR